MKFEIKNIELVGGVKNKPNEMSSQLIKIVVGVVGCPHDDITSIKFIYYDYSTFIGADEYKEGLDKLTKDWFELNYPEV